jgi:sortase A
MKLLEIMLWTVGALLVALYFGAQAWGEWARERGVSMFIEAQQSDASPRVAWEPPAEVDVPDAVAVAVQSPNEAVIAVLRIPGIELVVPVNYGTEDQALRRGAGLIEGTALPGTSGNVAIAAHRDTFFRGLKDLVLGDLIELDSRERTQTYRVIGLSVVEPTDVQVLADTGEPVLTLVTCYPFYFVGNAPQRFVVRAVADNVSI